MAYGDRDVFWKDLRQKGLVNWIPEKKKRLSFDWDLGQITQGCY